MKKEVEILVEVFEEKKEVLKKLSGLKFLGDKKYWTCIFLIQKGMNSNLIIMGN